jgi:hypothetical protein
MKATQGVVIAALMGLGALACSKNDGGSPAAGAGQGTSGSAGNASGGMSTGGGTGGGPSAGAPNNGPAITSAPPAWQPPADCGGIGNLCPNLSGCAARSSCQLEGNVCIPALVPGAATLPAKSMERPYCAAYTCMTFEEASCFCTGEAGKTEPRCQSPSALAGLCQGPKASCDADRPCCDGVSCVSHGGKAAACEQTCNADTDCESGCCTDPYDSGTKICANKSACDNPCKKRGDTTCTPGDATTASNCCYGNCNQSENPDWAGCRPWCNTDADCDTGCCEPYSNGSGFCTAAIYCMCSAVGGSCSPGSPRCCDDGACAGFTAETLTCMQKCKVAADCASGCCVALAGSDITVCESPEYCQ